MRSRLLALWQRLPVWIRAPAIAFEALNVGNTASVLPLAANHRFFAGIPWALPATLIVVVGF